MGTDDALLETLTMRDRIYRPSEPQPDPVSEKEFLLIEIGDIVTYQTKETGFRCGLVKARDVKKKRANSATKHLHNNRAPLIVTIGVGQMNRKCVSLTREQLREWRPANKVA